MYSLLFVSVGLLSWFIQWRKGLDAKIPPLQLSLSLALHIFLFMLFMKLPLWGEANTEHIASQRLLLTGVIGTLLASVISKHLLGIGYQRLDHAALSFPLVVIFSKIGCFFAGCCFGTVSGFPGAVSYGQGTHAHQFHMKESLIPENAISSLPVHPVQLYEAGLGVLLLVAVLLYYFRKPKAGSLLLITLSLYSFMRFGAEFFREPMLFNTTLFSIRIMQWALLGLGFAGLIMWRFNEKKSLFTNPIYRSLPVGFANVLLPILIFATYILSDYFHFIELVVIGFALAIAVFIFLRDGQALKRFSPWLSKAFLLSPLLLPVDSIPVVTDSLNQEIRYNTIKIGFSAGEFISYRGVNDTDGCGYITRDFNQTYTMWGASYAWVTKKKNVSHEWGVTAFGGRQRESYTDENAQLHTSSFVVGGVHPYYRYENDNLALGLGLNIGNLRFAYNENNDESTVLPTLGYWRAAIFPSAYFRAGPKSIIFFEGQLANAFPVASPAHFFQFGMGSGLGNRKGFSLRTGVSAPGFYYVGTEIPYRKLLFEGVYYFPTQWEGPTLPPPNLQFNVKVRIN